MRLVLDRTSPIPFYRQIADQLREHIRSGELAPGTKLPPERRLAAMLGVNRSTVVSAYRELASEGLITGHVGRGTTVAAVQPMPQPGGSPLPWAQFFTPITTAMRDPLLYDTMVVAARPDVISFATGAPAPELYPTDTVRHLLDEALHHEGQALLQYCPTEGYPPLREALAQRLRQQGARVTAEQVLIVSGSQQGLYLLARALLEPGDVVAIESPTYLGALQVFRAIGARFLPIPVDRHGMQVGMLEDLLARRRPKLIYTLPTFQNPTGATMTLERRQHLLDLATRYQIPIIEDDPYGALRYEGPALPPLFALDRAGTVIYLSTVSKVLFPGFRVGWVVGPQPVVERLSTLKQLVDLDTNALAQWAVWAFLTRGLLDRHLAQLRQDYPTRRDRMIHALEALASDLLTWERPAGGMYLWCRLREGLRARDLLPEAARYGVAFTPGESCFPDGNGTETLRLNFTFPAHEEIDEGIKRLAYAIRSLRASRAGRERNPALARPLV